MPLGLSPTSVATAVVVPGTTSISVADSNPITENYRAGPVSAVMAAAGSAVLFRVDTG